MTRSNAREIAVRACFGLSAGACSADELIETLFDTEYYGSLSQEDEVYGEYPDEKQAEYIKTVIRGIYEHSYELDTYVEKYSANWAFSRISRTAVAIMKTCMFEALYMPEVPLSAAINEAVELAKKYEEPDTVPFINGVLGAFAKGEIAQ